MSSLKLYLSKLKAALLPDKKLPGFFYNKSLHIIVGLCIIAIIVTSVWSANNPIEPESDKIISEQTQIENENQASALITDVEGTATKEDIEEGTNNKGIKEETTTGSNERLTTAANENIITVTNNEHIQEMKQEKEPDLSTMMPPVIGKIIVDYSMDKLVYSNTLEQWQTHSGIDIGADEGTAVKAVLAGTVIDTLNDSKLGNMVIIDHGAGIISKYGNLKSTVAVKKGQVVEKGEIIGAVGRSSIFESADPPHLHFEMEKDNSTINPNYYLPKIE